MTQEFVGLEACLPCRVEGLHRLGLLQTARELEEPVSDL